MDSRHIYLGIIVLEALLITWLIYQNAKLNKGAQPNTTSGVFTQYYGMPYPLYYPSEYGMNRL